MFIKFPNREEGQGLVEYALILVLVAIVVIAILLTVGPAINEVFCKVANRLQAGTCSGITITSQTITPGPFGVDIDVTIEVSEDASVTISTSDGSQSANCTANTPCILPQVGGPASPSSFTISSSSLGSTTVSY